MAIDTIPESAESKAHKLDARATTQAGRGEFKEAVVTLQEIDVILEDGALSDEARTMINAIQRNGLEYVVRTFATHAKVPLSTEAFYLEEESN